VTIDFKVVQKLRMMVRQKSLEVWKEKPDANYFDEEMRKYLKQLKLATKVYHYRRAIERRLNNKK
jgi:coenzyme F420 hydrogenase subunit beta